jgi:hypothetical protein
MVSLISKYLTMDSSLLGCDSMSLVKYSLSSCVTTLLGLPDPQHEGTTILWNTRKYSPNCMSHPKDLNPHKQHCKNLHSHNSYHIYCLKKNMQANLITKLSVWSTYYLSLNAWANCTHCNPPAPGKYAHKSISANCKDFNLALY